jgi:alkylglycerol monooxygenase
LNPLVFALPIFFIAIAFEVWLLHRKKKLALYDLADALTSAHMGIFMLIASVFITFEVYKVVYDNYRLVEWAGNPLMWVLALLFYDFCYYWVHRFGHEVSWIWASHIVHHSSEYYNLSTAMRQTTVGKAVVWVFYLPMALLGVPPKMFIIVGLIDLLYQFWVHTELVGRMGWFDRVFVSPSNHRVHHGQNDYCIDKNYGGLLVIWDRMFGTFAEERVGEKITYGVRKPLQSYNILWGNVHYWVDLWKLSRAAKGWRAKLGVWMAPPGGWTDQPIEHFEEKNFTRFAPSSTLRGYAAVQSVVLLIFAVHCIAGAGNLPKAEGLTYGALLAVSYMSIGLMLQGTAWVRSLELVRVLGMGLAIGLSTNWFGIDMPMAARAAGVLWGLTSAFFLLRQGKQHNAGVAA